ncbi:hypothetical protein GCM10010123_32020 [Pilimelia anulata]|uniref:Uncharacterized protein n=1 Tax=Pilimelia anulata TaxID=53371 RepID=A0A8J3FB22_9ACTN|nr:SurA N-terminal domain-containing protein [Pilimelia anulata]GGJ99639.1 hypothetical protein GCM10010123_32020 [Pilimelia anulata]
MQGRRIVAVIGVAGFALAGLVGCRSDPGVAAYVGDRRISDTEVAAVADEYVASLPAANQAAVNRTDLRAQVLRLMIVGDAVDAYARANSIPVAQVPLNEFATAQKLPPQIRLTPLFAKYVAGQDALRSRVKPVAPSEEQKREAYRNTTIQGRPLSEPFEAVSNNFSTETLGVPLALRDLVARALTDARVTVNPRYGSDFRVPFDIQSAESYYAVPMGPSVPVKDAPADAPRTAAPAEPDPGHDHG